MIEKTEGGVLAGTAPSGSTSISLAAIDGFRDNTSRKFPQDLRVLPAPRGLAWDVLAVSTKQGGYAVLLGGLNLVFVWPDGRREIATPAMMRTFVRGNTRILDQIRIILHAAPGKRRAVGSRQVLRQLLEKGLLR
jgi:hypothetical protein